MKLHMLLLQSWLRKCSKDYKHKEVKQAFLPRAIRVSSLCSRLMEVPHVGEDTQTLGIEPQRTWTGKEKRGGGFGVNYQEERPIRPNSPGTRLKVEGHGDSPDKFKVKVTQTGREHFGPEDFMPRPLGAEKKHIKTMEFVGPRAVRIAAAAARRTGAMPETESVEQQN